MERNEISAIILAGGMSSRMERFKPLLDLDGKPAILRAVETFKFTGVRDIIVVLGHSADLLEPVLASSNVRCIRNPCFKLGMFSSVQTGVGALDDSTEGFFILPADIPLIRGSTIRRLIRTYREKPASVLYPVFGNKRGHPPLIDVRYAKDILSVGPLGNLGSILELREKESLDVECPDAGIHMDMDTNAEYEGMRWHLLRRDIPTPEECVSLMRIYGVSDGIIRHGQAVAALAKRIAESLITRQQAGIDIDLLVAAGILHDIARGQPEHSLTGAAIMRKEGFPRLSECIMKHMELSLPDGDSWVLTEAEILYLSDKLVEEDRIVSLENRFARSEEMAGNEIRTVNKVRERRAVAGKVMKRVESCLMAGDQIRFPWQAHA